MCGFYFFVGSIFEKCGQFWKGPGGYDRIGEIQHGWIWLDWCLYRSLILV